MQPPQMSETPHLVRANTLSDDRLGHASLRHRRVEPETLEDATDIVRNEPDAEKQPTDPVVFEVVAPRVVSHRWGGSSIDAISLGAPEKPLRIECTIMPA